MYKNVQRVLITGANGFVGKNLKLRLSELSGYVVSTFVREDDVSSLQERLAQADLVVHLAGENRPVNESDYARVNAGLTLTLCDALRSEVAYSGRKLPVILASSIQAEIDNPYGRSKLAAEKALLALHEEMGNPVEIFRFPGVFGKWCKPNYNSVVATFCHNIARGLPIQINNESTMVTLVYIDDVISALVTSLNNWKSGLSKGVVQPSYSITLGELANQIKGFDSCRSSSLLTDRVGVGFTRALYATYISYLPSDRFSYLVPQHNDVRGKFVEMLKTRDSGQFSYFTAHPGVTRGGHYHHSKSEKFLVMRGEALFRFRHLLTNEIVEISTSGLSPQVVDTVPGWVHDITNIGKEDMVVMLWANENFEPLNPDTVASKV